MQAASVTHPVVRFNSGGKQLGSAWSYDVVVSEIEPLGNQQARVGAEHTLHFTDLTANMPAAGAATPASLQKTVDGLKNLFKKK